MRVTTKRKTTADDVRRVALAALATALDDGKQEAKKKPGLTGVRAVATGAVLYTAGRAAFGGRRFIRDHFGSDGEAEGRDDEEPVEDDEPRAEEVDEPEDEDEEYEDEDDEPRAEEGDEDHEDEEPRAEEDEEYEEEDEDDEPRAEDEEPDGEDEEDDESRAEEEDEPDDERSERQPSSRRPPARAKRGSGGTPDLDLPSRPSRPRAPVGRT